ncbi:Gmad2 immunoglobulin-like domain-containing protein [Dactylosporangium sp. NPDC049525]|uniref:Gmad2 immunoglobulin-like domain-containing protein n=1 Tax=Dactylosporangium sp. NPDC049525 TaxID=3154730 RepID=UPI003440361D
MRMSPEDRLRAALRAQVDTVEVTPDALPRIRGRIQERRRGGWAVIAAAAAVAAVIAVAVVVFVPDRTPPDRATDRQQPAVSATQEPVEPSAPVTTSGPVVPGEPVKVQLPVYYARNDRLVREFHDMPLPVDDDAHRIAASVGEALRAGSAADPDYVTLWPESVEVRGVTVAGKVVTVDLGDVGTAPRAGTPALAVQQLVSTVAAAATYTSVKRIDGVRITIDGAPAAKLWNTVDVSRPVKQAPPSEIYAPVWVIDPQQGQQVGRSFTVHLAGIVWEGTVNLRVRGTGGVVVVERVVQLSVGAPAVGEARVPLTLPPGRYTVEAYYISMADSSVQGVDDHEFTVG